MSQQIHADEHGARGLSKRLASFRKWLIVDANCVVHPSISIVNGEATDGTKNAPVLIYGRGNDISNAAASAISSASGGSSNSNPSSSSGTRCGIIDTEEEQILWDKTVGCQVRTVREVKKDEALLQIPRSSMVAPDIVAASDAGMSVFECCEGSSGDPWEMLCGTAEAVEIHKAKLKNQSGTQILVNILRERKRAEDVLAKAQREDAPQLIECKKAQRGTISSRAPFMAFLLQQRFGIPSGVEEFTLVQSEPSLEPEGPRTFAPYVLAFPSAFSLPICWKRNELALLSGCAGGFNLLLEVAAHTMVLSNDLIQLVKAGILHRFPDVFTKGSISWDTWVWAAAAWMSRAFPVSCYLKRGESIPEMLSEKSLPVTVASETVWDDMGVLVPLLDMMNHESEAGQIKWESAAANSSLSGDGSKESRLVSHQLISQKRIKKGSQICNCYGAKGNQELISQYGFAQIANPNDEMAMAWALADSVGDVKIPPDFSYLYNTELQNGENESQDLSLCVFESTDQTEINSWWTDERLKLLKAETMVDDTFIEKLVSGKKLSATAYVEGPYHPIFLAAAVVATMPEQDLKKLVSSTDSSLTQRPAVQITKRHQNVLRRHLEFFYKRKLEKLLANLRDGLKAHFNNVQLWTRATEGGLYYSGGSDGKIGWQSFFDTYAYSGAMEVEKRYYAIGADSCVLALYDGILRSVQASIEGTSESSFENILRQLVDLGFVILDENEEDNGEKKAERERAVEKDGLVNAPISIEEPLKDVFESDDANATKSVSPSNSEEMPHDKENNSDANAPVGNTPDEELSKESKTKSANGTSINESMKRDRAGGDKGSKKSGGNSGNSEGGRNRKRNKSKGGGNKDQLRPSAIKLHIGNLSYATLPSELFDYFSRIYGSGNVLECHIPTERETGKSRGFGFVTLPEDVALRVLDSERKHEIQGRLLKIARSNTAGSGKTSQSAPSTSSDRCLTCGYRPKYCTCPMPKLLMGVGVQGGLPVPPPPPPPPPGPPPMHPKFDEYPVYDSFGNRPPMGSERDPGWGRIRGHVASRSLSPSRRSDNYGHRGRERITDYSDRQDRDYRRGSYSRSRSLSYDRDDKSRKRRKRGRSRSRDRHGYRSSSSESERASRRRKSSRSSRHDYSSSRRRSEDSDSASGRGSRRRAPSREDRRERKRSRSSNSRSRSRPRHSANHSRSRSDSRSRGSRSRKKNAEQSQNARGRR